MANNYHFNISLESVWNILKWVLAALAAAFIGQFGRSLAVHIIERRRKDEARRKVDGGPLPAEVGSTRIEALQKIEKKRAKAEVKRLKKSTRRKGD